MSEARQESDELRTHVGVNLEEFVLRVPTLASRGLAYSLFVIMAAGLAWGYFSTAELVVGADGVLVPKGNGLGVHVPANGEVLEVEAEVGSQIKKGQVLFRLRSAQLRGGLANIKRARAHLKNVEHEQATLGAAQLAVRVAALEAAREKLAATSAIRSSHVASGRAAAKLAALTYELREREAETLKSQIRAAESERAIAEVEYKKSAKELANKERLLGRGLISGGDVSTARQQVRLQELRIRQHSETIHERKLGLANHPVRLAQLRARQVQAEVAARRQLRESDVELVRQRDAIRNAELMLRMQKQQTATALRSARQEVDQLQVLIPPGLELGEEGLILLRAPVSGVVTYCAVRQGGAFVERGNLLMRVAPASGTPVIRVEIPNEKIAHIRVGQEAKIKYHAYPFQDYGVFVGKVTKLPPDATGKGARPGYVVEITPDRSSLTDAGKETPLRLGLAAQVEIVTERKSLLSLFLKPFEALLKGDLTIDK